MRVFTDLSEVKNVWFGHQRNIGQRRPCSGVSSFVLVNKFVYLNKKLKMFKKYMNIFNHFYVQKF